MKRGSYGFLFAFKPFIFHKKALAYIPPPLPFLTIKKSPFKIELKSFNSRGASFGKLLLYFNYKFLSKFALFFNNFFKTIKVAKSETIPTEKDMIPLTKSPKECVQPATM